MRRVALTGGVAVLAALWLGPLPHWAAGSFAAHMTLHMGVVVMAAGLLALGLAGGRWDPVRAAPRLFAPIPAAALELAVVWAWHAPALHHFARGSAAGLVLEQTSFLLTGFAVWISAFGGEESADAGRRGAGVLSLLLTSMHMTLLGALLALTPRPLYAHGGVNALDDQQLGGAVMLLVGSVSYLGGGLWLTVGLLRQREPRAEGSA